MVKQGVQSTQNENTWAMPVKADLMVYLHRCEALSRLVPQCVHVTYVMAGGGRAANEQTCFICAGFLGVLSCR